jgi:hypothetical protein
MRRTHNLKASERQQGRERSLALALMWCSLRSRVISLSPPWRVGGSAQCEAGVPQFGFLSSVDQKLVDFERLFPYWKMFI